MTKLWVPEMLYQIKTWLSRGPQPSKIPPTYKFTGETTILGGVKVYATEIIPEPVLDTPPPVVSTVEVLPKPDGHIQVTALQSVASEVNEELSETNGVSDPDKTYPELWVEFIYLDGASIQRKAQNTYTKLLWPNSAIGFRFHHRSVDGEWDPRDTYGYVYAGVEYKKAELYVYLDIPKATQDEIERLNITSFCKVSNGSGQAIMMLHSQDRVIPVDEVEWDNEPRQVASV